MLLVVDAVEGVLVGAERAVRAAAAEGLPLCLLISKFDRLLLELKLPPADAYHKLRHTIEEVNALIATHYGDDEAHRVRRMPRMPCARRACHVERCLMNMQLNDQPGIHGAGHSTGCGLGLPPNR